MKDVIVFSSIDWDAVWQGPQELASRFAARGARVLFVENTGIRSPRLGDFGRIAHRLRRSATGTAPSTGKPPVGVSVFSPLVLPFPWNPLARWINRALLARRVARSAATFEDPLLLTFLPTPATIDAIEAARHGRGVVVYYCVSDFTEASARPQAVRAAEDRLLRIADVVFTNGTTLRDRFAGRAKRVVAFPYGVDTRQFRAGAASVAPEIAAIPGPRIGYIGGLHKHVDVGWIEAAADTLSHCSFVFVGPPEIDITSLARRTNVHLIGPRRHDELPGYVAGFDVCLIPYALNRYTQSAVPTKLFEYLAMGKPVVSSDLIELRALDLPPGTVAIAHDRDEFIDLISRALAGDAPGLAAVRTETARRHSWEARFDEMRSEIDRVAAR